MKVYLVQHGEALSKEVDPERPLSDKGKEDAGKVAVFLKNAGAKVDEIWHSAKKRAKETAGIFQRELDPPGGAIEKEGLAPNDHVRDVFDSVKELDNDVMIVGHLPFLEKIVTYALLGAEFPVIAKFNMGGVVALEKGEDGWHLALEIIPDLL